MYQQQALKTFLETLRDYLNRGISGSFFVMGKELEWGKIVLYDGKLVSVLYAAKKGREAFPLLEGLKQVKYSFQQNKPKAGRLIMPRIAQGTGTTSEEFFGYFGVGNLSLGGGGSAVNTSERRGVQTFPRSRFAVPKNHKILLVDDSTVARKATAIPLKDSGYAIVEAKDGFEALGQLENENPDLMILDLVMPGIDGYKVLDLLKRNSKFSRLPVIMLTSRDSLLDKLKGKMSESDAYLTKPPRPEDLLNTVKKLLP